MTSTDTDRTPSQTELRAEVERARAALAWTLDSIEEKLNVPKRIKRAGAELRVKAKRNPGAAVGVAVGVAVAVGAGVFGIVKLISRD